MASWNANGGDWIEKVASDLQYNAVNAFEEIAATTAEKIINDTPVGIDGGQLASNWQIKTKTNNIVLKTKNGAARKAGYSRKKIRGKLANIKRGKIRNYKNKTLYFFNNSPYVGVVEYGGYPDPVKLGTWNKRKKAYEIRSSGGFSKQAPSGMFRLNVMMFGRKIIRRFKSL